MAPNPKSPIPNPQSPIPNPHLIQYILKPELYLLNLNKIKIYKYKIN
jgi:hypothetical protein